MSLTLRVRPSDAETRAFSDPRPRSPIPEAGESSSSQVTPGTGSPHSDPAEARATFTSATTWLWFVDIPPAVEQRLEYLAGLHPNWDDQGTAQVSLHTVEMAKWFLRWAFTEGGGTLPHPFIDVAFDGRLVLEWETSEGREIIVDVPTSMEDPIAFLLVEVGPDSREIETPGEIGYTWTPQGIIRRLLPNRRMA